MERTIDLLQEAMQRAQNENPKASRRMLSQQLGMTPTALTNAAQRQKLSPIVAGKLAQMLGMNIEHWMAVAVIENETKSRETESLRRAITRNLKS